MTIAAAMKAPPPRRERDYLRSAFTLRSWLLTTDHKRVAILYLVTLTLFFFIGGAAAVVFRLELLTPEGDLMTPDTYNHVFTMHGVFMVFLFVIGVMSGNVKVALSAVPFIVVGVLVVRSNRKGLR